MPPSEVYNDFAPVFLRAPVLFATYGPEHMPLVDVTQQVRKLQMQGTLEIVGGIHLYLGDNFPNIPKLFKVWYATEPAATFPDFANVVLPQETIIAASYGPAGMYVDCFAALSSLGLNSNATIFGGAHTVLGDNFPGVPKFLRVWTL